MRVNFIIHPYFILMILTLVNRNDNIHFELIIDN
jgi:hypothetical protein